jgi:predicted Zn-ribbon and HTH transcriptional regulator
MTETTLQPMTKVRVGRETYVLTQEAAAELAMAQAKKSKTYLLKAECPECGYTIRVTRKHVSAAGCPACPACSDYASGYIVPLLLETKEGESA